MFIKWLLYHLNYFVQCIAMFKGRRGREGGRRGRERGRDGGREEGKMEEEEEYEIAKCLILQLLFSQAV